jgi:hypothetical protein
MGRANKILVPKPNLKNHVEDFDIHRRIILKVTLEEYDVTL